MAKYKISKENINEFFVFFGKKNKPKDIDTIIKNDPILQKIDKEIGDLNDKAALRLQKDADAMKILKKLGIEIK
jgi:hypothetical protein